MTVSTIQNRDIRLSHHSRAIIWIFATFKSDHLIYSHHPRLITKFSHHPRVIIFVTTINDSVFLICFTSSKSNHSTFASFKSDLWIIVSFKHNHLIPSHRLRMIIKFSHHPRAINWVLVTSINIFFYFFILWSHHPRVIIRLSHHPRAIIWIHASFKSDHLIPSHHPRVITKFSYHPRTIIYVLASFKSDCLNFHNIHQWSPDFFHYSRLFNYFFASFKSD